jgi:CBS domain containing-hemolysin-like protein
VLNHDLTITQAIKAQIADHHCSYALVYHSGRREFIGIFTLRNLLELVVSLEETLELVYAET